MTTGALVTVNLPTIVERPEIEAEQGTIKCQVYSRAYVVGTGFVFTYCEGTERYLISWSVSDRWRTRQQLRVCERHGREFAHAHGGVGRMFSRMCSGSRLRADFHPREIRRGGSEAHLRHAVKYRTRRVPERVRPAGRERMDVIDRGAQRVGMAKRRTDGPMADPAAPVVALGQRVRDALVDTSASRMAGAMKRAFREFRHVARGTR